MVPQTNGLADDPSVIVGLACRVPGADKPSKLWQNITSQRDVQQKMPEDRMKVDSFYHPEPTHKGTVRNEPRSRRKVFLQLTADADKCPIRLLS